jgi:hypothetical protein
MTMVGVLTSAGIVFIRSSAENPPPAGIDRFHDRQIRPFFHRDCKTVKPRHRVIGGYHGAAGGLQDGGQCAAGRAVVVDD